MKGRDVFSEIERKFLAEVRKVGRGVSERK